MGEKFFDFALQRSYLRSAIPASEPVESDVVRSVCNLKPVLNQLAFRTIVFPEKHGFTSLLHFKLNQFIHFNHSTFIARGDINYRSILLRDF
jgi:hypothetical protein